VAEKISVSQIEAKELYNQTGSLIESGIIVTSAVVYVGGYSHITGYVYSDQASATDGVVIEQCQRADLFAAGAVTTANVTSSSMTYTAADITSNALSVQIVAPFARIVYVNGAVTQATDFNIFFCARIIRGL